MKGKGRWLGDSLGISRTDQTEGYRYASLLTLVWIPGRRGWTEEEAARNPVQTFRILAPLFGCCTQPVKAQPRCQPALLLSPVHNFHHPWGLQHCFQLSHHSVMRALCHSLKQIFEISSSSTLFLKLSRQQASELTGKTQTISRAGRKTKSKNIFQLCTPTYHLICSPLLVKEMLLLYSAYLIYSGP